MRLKSGMRFDLPRVMTLWTQMTPCAKPVKSVSGKQAYLTIN